MGKCQYVLAKHTGTFEVLQQNEPCGRRGATCSKAITVNIKGLKIHIVRGGIVTVDGVPVTPPYNNKGRVKERFIYKILPILQRKK